MSVDQDINTIISNLDKNINKFNNKTILFAGGGGFLGYYFSEFFIKLIKDYQVNCKIIFADNFVSSSTDYSTKSNNIENIEFLNLDICSPSVLNLKYKFDFIIHAAGIASPFYYRKKPLETLDVSIIGSKNLLELARVNNAKYTFFSSSEIYGDPHPDFVPIPETYRGNVSTMGPRACYDEGKRLGETLCYVYENYHDVHTNIIRPFNIYGPGMKKNDYRVMSNFTNNFLNNQPLKVYGKGDQTRTFCYVSDGIEGFLRVILLGKKGSTYNIGTSKPEIKMIELAELFFDIHKMKKNIEIVEYPNTYPSDEPSRRCPNTSKASIEIKFDSKVNLEEGIKRYVNWCKINF